MVHYSVFQVSPSVSRSSPRVFKTGFVFQSIEFWFEWIFIFKFKSNFIYVWTAAGNLMAVTGLQKEYNLPYISSRDDH